MDVDFNGDVGRWVNRKVDVDSIADGIGGLDIETGVGLVAFWFPFHSSRTKGENVDAQPDAYETQQLLNKAGVVLVFRGNGHSFQGSVIVTDAQPGRFADLVDEFLVLFPTHVVKGDDSIGRKLGNKFEIALC